MGAEGRGTEVDEREVDAEATGKEAVGEIPAGATWPPTCCCLCFLPLRWRASDSSSVRCSTSWHTSQVAQLGPPRLDGKENVKRQRLSSVSAAVATRAEDSEWSGGGQAGRGATCGEASSGERLLLHLGRSHGRCD